MTVRGCQEGAAWWLPPVSVSHSSMSAQVAFGPQAMGRPMAQMKGPVTDAHEKVPSHPE
jgi:hypothetical protein